MEYKIAKLIDFMVEKKVKEKGICERLEKNKFSLTTRVKVDVMNGSAKRVMGGGKESYIHTFHRSLRLSPDNRMRNMSKTYKTYKIITV